MISREWRQRLTYTAMSIIVAWHTTAMIVAPAPPDSDLTQALRTVLQPYLTLFRLDNEWDFFAPTVGEGSRLRYVIEDKAGARHTFTPADELSWFHPNYFWFRAHYYAIMDEPENYAESAAARFCEKHAALQPASITLQELQEERFTREDFLSGKNRTDPEFFTVKTVRRMRCPGN
jgi:hypothetical protein